MSAISYMIFDDHGNAIGAYDSEHEAHEALLEINDPDVALLSYDVSGHLVGPALLVGDLSITAKDKLGTTSDPWWHLLVVLGVGAVLFACVWWLFWWLA